MNVPAFSLHLAFRAQPLGFGLALLFLICLAPPVRGAALGSGAGCWPVAGSGCSGVASGSAAEPSQEIFSICGAAVMCAPHGVTAKISRHAVGVRRAGICPVNFLQKYNDAIPHGAARAARAVQSNAAGMMVTPAGRIEERHV